jgi:hypothetical protein
MQLHDVELLSEDDVSLYAHGRVDRGSAGTFSEIDVVDLVADVEVAWFPAARSGCMKSRSPRPTFFSPP